MVLIFDIETFTPDGRPNPKVDIPRFIAFYEYENDTYHFLSANKKKEILEIFQRHRVIVGFNSWNYDIPILKRHGLYRYKHCHIDLMESVKKRSIDLGVQHESMSLANLAKCFKIALKKEEFDYALLNKKELTEEELKEIETYAIQDAKVTKEMFDYLCKFFEPFKHFMNKRDIRDYKWLSSSIAAYVYKVICHRADIPELYKDTNERQSFVGGLVCEPSQAAAHIEGGPIYLKDFSSLYPHNSMQANLFSHKCRCCTEEEKWAGNELFKVEGKYCSKKRGKIEEVILEFFKERLQLKEKGDAREQALKKVINTLYGLLGNPVFESLYNHTSASDCTLIGRTSTMLVREALEKEGYVVLYSDTDSVFIQDPFNSREALDKLIAKIIKVIKDHLPFPSETFDMTTDEEIKHIWFFEKNEKFLKKHYMYVTTDNRLVLKGLPMIKNDSSKIGYYIFKKHMKDRVIAGEVSFTYNELRSWLYKELEANLEIATRTFKVWEPEQYKNESQLQAQIAIKHGAGTHKLLGNKYIGVGKSQRYCTIEEFKAKGMSLHALVMDKYWSEMSFFSNYIPDGFKRGKDNSQVALTAWTDM